MADHIIPAAEVEIGVEVIIRSDLAESFADHYVTITDKGLGDDEFDGAYVVLEVTDRTGRTGTLVVRPETLVYA